MATDSASEWPWLCSDDVVDGPGDGSRTLPGPLRRIEWDGTSDGSDGSDGGSFRNEWARGRGCGETDMSECYLVQDLLKTEQLGWSEADDCFLGV